MTISGEGCGVPGVRFFVVVHPVFVLSVVNRIPFLFSSSQVPDSESLVSDARARVSYRWAKAIAVDRLGKIFRVKHESVPHEKSASVAVS